MYNVEMERTWYSHSASRVTYLAHFFGGLTILLMLIWLLHYREGFDLNSPDNSRRIFNVHPFLMFFGFIFFAGEAMMTYKTVRGAWRVKKCVHMGSHVIAIVLGIVGIYAAFKYHHKNSLMNMYTIHSWIGLTTFILYGLQWLFGFFTFWMPQSDLNRAKAAPWHVCLGRALLYMAICTAETGLMQIFLLLKLVDGHEARLINFIGLSILLFGITVDLSVAFARYI